MGRADFHQQHAERARAEAARQRLGPRWLGWVAGELYHLSPAEFAAMVRRELQQQAAGDA